LKLASGVVVIEYVVGRILAVNPFAIAAFNHVDAIFFTIKNCVNITHLSPFMAGKP
jgi:gamma-glutamylcysteine synthetase